MNLSSKEDMKWSERKHIPMVCNAISFQKIIYTSSSCSKYLLFVVVLVSMESADNFGRIFRKANGDDSQEYLNLFLKQRQIQLNTDFISAVFLSSSLETLPFHDWEHFGVHKKNISKSGSLFLYLENELRVTGGEGLGKG